MPGDYPHVPHNDPGDDAAACLATLALAHGIDCTFERARKLLRENDRGNNLAQLREAAEAVGFMAKGVKGPFDALTKIPLPAVAHTKDSDGGHFVILHEVTPEGVIVGFGSGIVAMSFEAFQEQWTGNLLIVVPSTPRAARRSVMDAVLQVLRRWLGPSTKSS